VTYLAMSGSYIFAGTWGNGVYLSVDNGTSWTALNIGLTNTAVRSLAVSGSNLFAGTWGGGVYVYNGTYWTTLNIGLTNTAVRSLAVSGSNLFAGTWGGGVYLYNGTYWTAVNNDLTQSTVMSLGVSGSNIFAGTWGTGVYLSTNSGTSWTSVNSGFPANTYVWSLAMNGSYIFTGTTNGVWRRPLSEMVRVINPIPRQEMLKQYANGFKINLSKNGIAVLSPETLHNGAVTIELVNVSGKKIYSATHQTNNGTLNIPISRLSTSAYLMSITGRNATMCSPFVVTK
jgi:hypothetical protein